MKINKYYLITSLFLFSLVIPEFEGLRFNFKVKAYQADNVADSLHNIGHASMKIKTTDGKIIYIDPFHTPGDYTDSADVILVTHAHGDHNQVNLVPRKANCVVIRYIESNINGVYQSFDVDGIKIYSVAAYNGNHNINECVGYVIEFNGIKIYHAGDTGNIPEMAELANSNITYALLPVDSIYTMTPVEATEAAEMIQAAYSIPMHTEPPPDNYNEDKVSRFTPGNRLLIRNGETIALVSPSTNIGNDMDLPLSFKLYQSYPNPFNPNTTINFSIPTSSFVSLKVFDVSGREVATLVSEQLPVGNHYREWIAADIPSGVYFYRIEAGSFTDTKKFVLLK
jgi:L-ascorbate metabolism protein UlaG (beta-lactamase superfamily)